MKALLAAALIFAAPVAHGDELDALIGAPYAERLAAASSADRLAWTIVERGVANLWTAAAPDFTPRALTRYAADDGQALSDVALSPDGAMIVFARGDAGGVNPAGLAKPGARALYLMSTAGGAPRSLGAGVDPRFSPDGANLYFRREGALWVAPTRRAGAPQRVLETPGGVTAFALSPDGRAVAFESARGAHGVIGLYEFGAGRVRWIMGDAAFDSAPVWSPDSARVAFVRTPARDRLAARSAIDPAPFAIHVADAASGAHREIWRAPGEDGAPPLDQGGVRLRWSGAGLTFISEHDGWARLYTMTPDGAGLTALSPPSCEAGESDPRAGSPAFSANCGDLDKRRVWHGAPAAPISPADAIATAPTALGAGRYVAYRSGGPRHPQQAHVWDTQERKTIILSPPSASPSAMPELAVPQSVRFAAADGAEARGQLFLPPADMKGARAPAIIFVHGGPFYQTYAGWHDIGVFAMSYAYNQYLARRGYVVLSVNYRSGAGYGRDFRRAPGAGPLGASEYQDVLGAARYLQARSDVDGARIGVWGGSYGGYLTALALAKNSDVFKAGVDISGFHDWTYRWARGGSPAEAFGVTPEREAAAFQSSPLAHLKTWRSPVLIIAGDQDEIIPIEESIDLAARLRTRGVSAETMIFPGEGHIFATHEHVTRKLRAVSAFFDSTLAPDAR